MLIHLSVLYLVDEKHNTELKEEEDSRVAEKEKQLDESMAEVIAAKGEELAERQASETGMNVVVVVVDELN